MIKKLDWDSDFFEIEVGEANLEIDLNVENAAAFELLYLKSNTDFKIEINNFQNTFQETKLLFSKKLIDITSKTSNIFSVFDLKYDIEELYTLAYESGKQSRFFLDKNFQKDKFFELYRAWVDNSISGQFANDVLLYQENNLTLGFVTFKINKQAATIGLIAVNVNEQGKGIGAKLLTAVENILIFKNIKTLYIPTQKSNIQACNFYKKQGYLLHEKTFIKQYWKK